MSLEIRSSQSLTIGERAELFTAAYEDYVLPFQIDEAALATMEEVFDLDVEASRIAYLDDAPVGLGNLGVRDEDAWIGGVGVVPAARRSGVGETLMQALHEQARDRGVQRVWLEVIVENAAAFALYEKLGYRTMRDVEVWSLSAEDGPPEAREVSAAEAHSRLRELRSGREPWQRADETLAHYPDVRGLAAERGAAVYRQPGDIVQLIQIAGEGEPLLSSLRRLGRVSVLNLPVGDPAAPVLRELGATAVVRQHEMQLDLAASGEH